MTQIIRECPCNIREIVKKASEDGVERLAIANKGIMFNVPRFYTECLNNNIQPIIGCELPLDTGTSVTLFAKNNAGYHNLMALSSMACSTMGTIEKPMISRKSLNTCLNGLTENPEEVSGFGLEFTGPTLPKIKIPEEYDNNAEFCLWTKACHGLIQLLTNGKIPKDKLKEYESRLIDELSIINRFQLSNYFLIVNDYVNWAKENGCGPCVVFGSAAGSFLLYCLGISDLDPIENCLIFERFLNPDKHTLPYINIQVPVGCREKIFNYLEETYGKGCVAQVASFSGDGSYVGCNPNAIAISKSDLVNAVPLFINENGKRAVQYSCVNLEYYGPVKFDIYENANLSLIKEAEKEFAIPLDQSINDIAVFYALDRPNFPDAKAVVLKNKSNNTPCEPIIDCLKPILGPTYGCFVFEEQFIDAVCAVTGWDKTKADFYRKILAQRRKLFKEEYEKDFIASALANGHSEEKCQKLIKDFDFFIGNLFLKSQALEMATIIYKVSYIKCHYPELFEKFSMQFEEINSTMQNYI